MIVCLFAFLALMSIWYHIGRGQKDKGQVWLALSILCWSISGGLEVYFGSRAAQGDLLIYSSGAKSIVSLLNSLFILLALPWFRHLPAPLESIIKSKYWTLIVGLPFLFSLLPTVSKLITRSQNSLIRELDVYYSVLTLLILGWVLWQSFVKRRLILLAVLSTICIAVTFIAQLYKLTDSATEQLLYSAIFKSSLIMIFFALALSWVKDLTESLHSKSGKALIKLKSTKKPNGRYTHSVLLTGIFNNKKEIVLSNTHFQLLKRFASKRKHQNDDWLEIKPKTDQRNGKSYEINDHNEIKRMLHAILDAQLGKGSWSREHHELPLRQFLIERSPDRERKVRLALAPEQITIS